MNAEDNMKSAKSARGRTVSKVFVLSHLGQRMTLILWPSPALFAQKCGYARMHASEVSDTNKTGTCIIKTLVVKKYTGYPLKGTIWYYLELWHLQ